MRPVIAIAADTIPDTTVFTKPNTIDMAPTMFKDTILQAGGLPIILPFPTDYRQQAETIAAALTLFDGLVIPGGPDVDPTYYGQQPLVRCGAANPPRDCFEIALIKATYAAGKPLFGLCRGCHIINVAFGDTLYQDLNAQKPDALRHLQPTSGEYPTHHVTMVPGTRLHHLIGERAYVNSRHHQAVRTMGTGLRITARAADGLIEAFESISDDRVMGLQWHPENLWQDDPVQLNIYTDFIARAQRVHGQRAGA